LQPAIKKILRHEAVVRRATYSAEAVLNTRDEINDVRIGQAVAAAAAAAAATATTTTTVLRCMDRCDVIGHPIHVHSKADRLAILC